VHFLRITEIVELEEAIRRMKNNKKRDGDRNGRRE
jgi:hypothetical protein